MYVPWARGADDTVDTGTAAPAVQDESAAVPPKPETAPMDTPAETPAASQQTEAPTTSQVKPPTAEAPTASQEKEPPAASPKTEAPNASHDGSLDALVDMSLVELMNVRVTVASKTPMKPAEAPSIITVIQRATIEAMGYRSVAEALRSVPGFYVADDLVTNNISVRGTHGGPDSWSRVLKVMINGHAATYHSSGGTLLGDELLPIDAVERIEIIRGTGAALYGANAFLGVVNVVTRRPDHAGAHLRLSGEFGAMNNDRWGGSGDVAGSLASGDNAEHYVTFALRRGRFDRSGLTVPATSPLSADYAGQSSEQDLSRPRSVFVDSGLGLGDLGTLNAQYIEQTLDADAQFSDISVLGPGNRIAIRNQMLGLSHRLGLGDHLQVHTTGRYSYGADLPDERLDAGAPLYTYRRERSSHTTTVGSEISYERWGHTALVGYEYQSLRDSGDTTYLVFRDDAGASAGNQIRGTPGQPIHIMDHGVIAQLIVRPMVDLTVIGGARYAWNNIWGNSLNYRMGATYYMGRGLSTKLIYGTSYVPPAPTQLQQEPVRVDGGIVGNPDLKSQKASTGEIELSYTPVNWFDFAVNGFYTKIEDRVEFVYAGTQLTARNVVPSQTLGFEAEGRVVRRGFFSTANISYQWTTATRSPPLDPYWWHVLYDESGAGGNRSLYHPTWMGHGEVGGSYERLHAQGSLRVSYVGARKSSMDNIMRNHTAYLLPSYFVLDLTIRSLELNLLRGQATVVSLHVNNLFDSRGAEPGALGVDIPRLGRTWFLRASQEF
jgi:outer membrane receptor for ferrienterochelin and colicins